MLNEEEDMNRPIRRATPERFTWMPAAIAVTLVMALLLATPAAAQITRGAISGTARDATGAVLPGATVAVTNMATNISRTIITDAQGFYRVAGLDPGRYAVRAELAGFTTVENKNIDVRTASDIPLDF